MTIEYGQFCPVAKAAEILGERWTLLVVRELLLGTTRFSDLQKALPKASPTILAKRLKELQTAGLIRQRKATALRRATGPSGGPRTGPATLQTSAERHLQGQPGGRATADLRYAAPSQTNLDRNTVDMDRERASFVDNSLKYEATLRFINGSVKTMLDAIKGQ